MHVGMKNAIELLGDLSDYYDFGINESCHVWNECGVSTLHELLTRLVAVVYNCCFPNGVRTVLYACVPFYVRSRVTSTIFLLPWVNPEFVLDERQRKTGRTKKQRLEMGRFKKRDP